jgi:methyl-accepting chemotaxis protein
MTKVSSIASPLQLAGLQTMVRSPYAGVPLLLTLAGAALLLAMGGLSVTSAAAAVFLVGCGVYAGRLLVQRNAASHAAVRTEARREIARLGAVCSNSAPVWISQIETVRREADQQVADLTRLFAAITDKLEQVMGPTRRAGAGSADDQMLAGLARNGTELERLVGALRALQESKARIIADIGKESGRLKENAAEIHQIAVHTRLVSLNATIEAARAGAAGKPLAVIVDDMRALAVRTTGASEQFSWHTDRLALMVAEAFSGQDPAAGEGTSIPWAQQLVQEVVESFEALVARLARSIEQMEHERSELRQDISRALVCLQFQDRASQILSHVTQNLADMQRHIDTGSWSSLDVAQWKESMAANYSTHEEFGNLHGTRLPVARPVAEVTYF